MADLVTNGSFASGITSWAGTAAYEDQIGYKDDQGCVAFEVGEALSQTVTVPEAGSLIFKFAAWFVDDGDPLSVKLCWPPHNYLSITLDRIETIDRWREYQYRVVLPAGDVDIDFEVVNVVSNPAEVVYIDDVQLLTVEAANSCSGLAFELQKRRQDLAGIKHPLVRYEQLVNQVIRDVPRALWQTVVDTSLATVDEQRAYSLATLTGLTARNQISRLWIDDDDGNPQQKGRWTVQDNAGTLTLMLDDDPVEAGRTITIEYDKAHAGLDCYDIEDTTTLDTEYTLRTAMVKLLLEARPTELETPKMIESELSRWDRLRQSREQELILRRRRGASKARTKRRG